MNAKVLFFVIRHLVCDTSFGHIRRPLRYLWTIATRKRNYKKNKIESDPELNSVPHGPRNYFRHSIENRSMVTV